MSSRTIFLSRLLGLYCILIALAELSHKEAMMAITESLLHNASAMFVLSLLAVVAGLAMVLSHNVWSGGALPVTVTLLGWLALAKGLIYLFFPMGAASAFLLGGFRYEEVFYLYAAVPLLIGICLTYAGFKSARR
jgi:hypothetical protein